MKVLILVGATISSAVIMVGLLELVRAARLERRQPLSREAAATLLRQDEPTAEIVEWWLDDDARTAVARTNLGPAVIFILGDGLVFRWISPEALQAVRRSGRTWLLRLGDHAAPVARFKAAPPWLQPPWSRAHV